MSLRNREICRILAPSFEGDGSLLFGLDAIGDYLREVNVTRPLGHPLDVWIAHSDNLFVIVPKSDGNPEVLGLRY
ncbi:MAG: hypothetical protein IH856_20895 [Deltaproteobacteria bacterium]|nr:hypothetical protein [Deltaproteobacteria bacterium]